MGGHILCLTKSRMSAAGLVYYISLCHKPSICMPQSASFGGWKSNTGFAITICSSPLLKYWIPWLFSRQHFGHQWCSISVSKCIMELLHTKGHTSNPWKITTTGEQIPIEIHYRSFKFPWGARSRNPKYRIFLLYFPLAINHLMPQNALSEEWYFKISWGRTPRPP